MYPTIRRAVFIPLFCLLALGCGGKGNVNAPAKITGKVTYKGAPVTGGTVTFHVTGQGAYNAGIGKDGHYSANQLPTGDAVITVETESVNPDKDKEQKATGPYAEKYKAMMAANQSAGSGPSGAYVKIPSKYADPKTSGLTYTIQGGNQKKDVELTD